MLKKIKTRTGIKSPLIEEDIDSNKIDGLSATKKEKIKANKALEVAKEIEQTSHKNYVWIFKDKTSKLVNPKKVRKYLKEGWRKLKTNKI